MHRFPSLALKSRIDARISQSSARILSTSPQHAFQHAFHHVLTTCLALGVLHGDGLHSGSTAVRQWRQKRVLMRPEAAFPYVSAAEGAQHPPKKPPRSTPCRSEKNRRNERTAAAKRTSATKSSAASKRTAATKSSAATKNPSRRCVHHPRHQDGQKYLKESDYSA